MPYLCNQIKSKPLSFDAKACNYVCKLPAWLVVYVSFLKIIVDIQVKTVIKEHDDFES
jgi:hypothetical protein